MNQSKGHNSLSTKMLLTGAVGFYEAASALLKNDDMFHWPAFFVNLSYSFELSLKSMLVYREVVTYNDLKKIGHDLSKSLSMAISFGYKLPDPNISDLISILSPLHMRNELRYMRGGVVEIPDAEQARQLAWLHIQAIGDQIPINDLP
ncbi:hypothetical protein IC614_09640 [Allosphingosinicella flava]|uniref:HEPN domain-containing protein n=1 Tax=Allosphingosinicella flava TaxID=2771430 RepID=A0A7T2GIP1_9SPHN|nr:hypothetical protein [Sphingosinicella flava]QPQ54585.1 hypothetical protein IC614_09640 [Sphingosinicella flava]